jgi:hypothetical protein
MMAAAIFEATLSPEQAAELARLMEEGRPTRPAGVLTVALLYDGDRGQLVAIWKSRDALEQYVAETDVPRGRELMRKVGVEPTMTVVDVLDLG